MSWYPLGHGDKSLMEEPVFAELGEKYGKSPAQVILRWHTQMGFVVIPGSKNVDHIKDNLDIMDFRLTEEEMARIAQLDRGERYYHRTTPSSTVSPLGALLLKKRKDAHTNP